MNQLKEIFFFTIFGCFAFNFAFCQGFELKIAIQDTLPENKNMLLAYKQFHKSNNSISVEYSKVIDSLKKAGFLNLNSQKIKTDSIIFMNIYLNEKIDSIILSHASIPFQKIFKIDLGLL